MYKKLAVALLGFTYSFWANAQALWIWDLDVAFIISNWQGNNRVMLYKDGVPYKPCNSTEYYSFNVAESGGSAIQSALLTTYTAKRKVSAIFDCNGHHARGIRNKQPEE